MRRRLRFQVADARALRIETVVNDACDLGCGRLLPNLGELQARARDCNRCMLNVPARAASL